jgi:uncharacterized protein (DUF1778 family)
MIRERIIEVAKDQFVIIRVSNEEKELLKELAKESDMSISKYIIHTSKEKKAASNFKSTIEREQLSFFDTSKISFCRICGHELTKDSLYCTCCGTKLE